MNHRELVLSANKKAKFAFLKLPEELQDEVIDGLDGQTLTLEGARDLVKARGHSLSHVAIAGYYQTVRAERKLYYNALGLERIIKEYANQPYDEALRSLVNLIVATAATGVADGSVGIKDIDLGKVLAAMNQRPSIHQGDRHAAPTDPGAQASQSVNEGERRLDIETLMKVREQIYGVL